MADRWRSPSAPHVVNQRDNALHAGRRRARGDAGRGLRRANGGYGNYVGAFGGFARCDRPAGLRSLLGYVVWTADRLTLITADRRLPGCSLSLARPGGRVGAGPAVRPFLAPRLASYCEIAMSVTMAYMLVTML